MPEPAGTHTPKVLSPTRYLAWLYSQPSQQATFAALFEIESEIAASLRPGIDHHVAHARLQWWKDEAERTARGQPVHPLTRRLPQTTDISGFIDTAVWDLASATFETRKELTAYCERWAAVMFQSSVSSWRRLGAFVREVELLANLGSDAHAGRLRLPLDELERVGVGPDDVLKSPWPAPLESLLRDRHRALRAAIADGVAVLEHEAQESGRGLMVWVALSWRMSLRAEGALPDTVAPRRYHALTDGWQAWRAARRATKGSLRLG